MPEFMAALAADTSLPAQALRTTIYTIRTGVILTVMPHEPNSTWIERCGTIPGRAHEIAQGIQAFAISGVIALLEKLPRGEDRLFKMSQDAMLIKLAKFNRVDAKCQQ